MGLSRNQEVQKRAMLNKIFLAWYAKGHSVKPPEKLQHCCVSFVLEILAYEGTAKDQAEISSQLTAKGEELEISTQLTLKGDE